MGCPTEQIPLAVVSYRLAFGRCWFRGAVVAARDAWFAPKEVGLWESELQPKK